MTNRPFRLRCRKCLYAQGNVRFITCPCLDCKVFGGKNPPPTAGGLFGGKHSGKEGSE